MVGDAIALTIDGSKRSILSKNSHTCAEPAPDAMATLAAEFGTSIAENDKENSLNLMIESFSNTDVVQLFKRSQGLQALRDGMFRLCEARMNDSITQEFYEEQMIDLIASLNFIVPLELCANAATRVLNSDQASIQSVEGSTAPDDTITPPLSDPDLPKSSNENPTIYSTVGSHHGVTLMTVCADLAQKFGIVVNNNATKRLNERRQQKRLDLIEIERYKAFLEHQRLRGNDGEMPSQEQ